MLIAIEVLKILLPYSDCGLFEFSGGLVEDIIYGYIDTDQYQDLMILFQYIKEVERVRLYLNRDYKCIEGLIEYVQYLDNVIKNTNVKSEFGILTVRRLQDECEQLKRLLENNKAI